MIETALAKGRELPPWVGTEPDLNPGDDFFLTAFYDLSTCRQYSESVPGHIPWTAIAEYSDRSGLYPETAAGFIRVIRSMDSVFLQWHAGKQKQEMDKQQRRSKYNPSRNKTGKY